MTYVKLSTTSHPALPPNVYEKVSLIMTAPDLWLCVNVGVDGVDIMAKEMSVVWLVVDFFSNYHRSDVRKQFSELKISKVTSVSDAALTRCSLDLLAFLTVLIDVVSVAL